MERTIIRAKRKGEGVLNKSARVVELLEQALGEGHFEVGDRFLSTYDIAKEYGVSPGTARKAMGELVSRGYLETSHRSGYFLRPEGTRLAARKKPPEVSESVAATATALLVIVGQTGHRGARVLEQYLHALGEACSPYGWEVVRANNRTVEIEEAMKGRRLAGCLAYGLDEPPAAKINAASVITWNGNWSWREHSYSALGMDEEDASRLAHERLWDLGHQRVALVRPLAWEDSYRSRRGSVLGMRKAYAALGQSWSPEDVIHVVPENLPGLYAQIRGAGITGIYCEDWDIVVELYRQAHQLGETIGQQLSLITIGGYDLADMMQPRAARIYWRAMDFAAIVIQAVRRREEGKPMPRQLTLPVFLEDGPSARPLVAGMPGGGKDGL
jgi:DNA-binding LacI/PurR family transcriptional regulator